MERIWVAAVNNLDSLGQSMSDGQVGWEPGTTDRLQDYWVFGLFPSSGILENTTFRKLDLFPSSGEGGGEDTY
jgi:hypothetical protein